MLAVPARVPVVLPVGRRPVAPQWPVSLPLVVWRLVAREAILRDRAPFQAWRQAQARDRIKDRTYHLTEARAVVMMAMGRSARVTRHRGVK